MKYIAEALRPLAIPIESVNLDAANARLHPDKNIEAILRSLTRFGQRLPIVVQREGMIVRAGNGRVVAAKKLGWKHIAAVVVDEVSVEATAFAIADNRTAELATWDDDTLASLLQSLPDDARLDAGFVEDDLKELMDRLTPADVVEDEAPEPLPTPVSKTGDLWVMGGHRILCGDSTRGEDVGRVMGGEKADMVLTDPPYGVDYVGKTKDALKVENDGADGLEALLRASLGIAAQSCRPGAAWYVAAPAGPQFLAFGLVLTELGVWRQTLAWVKDSMVMGHSDFHYKHEAVIYGWTPGAAHREPPTRTCTSVLEFARPKRSTEHPTMKPIELWAFLMGASSGLDDLLYEPFSGSGTTIIASEQLGRRCYAIEISPQYVDVAVRRWEKLTGKQATLEDTGATWAETAAERGVDVTDRS